MKIKSIIALTILALGTSALLVSAQDNNNDGPPGSGGPGGGPGGPGGPRPSSSSPPLPIVTALDANHDGVIDATEIGNAGTALLTLDQNGDGVLNTNEYLPRPPPMRRERPAPTAALIVKAPGRQGDGVSTPPRCQCQRRLEDAGQEWRRRIDPRGISWGATQRPPGGNYAGCISRRRP